MFHAASQWSFRAASRWVDMLFYSSVAENNELIQAAKIAMTDGVVVPRAELVSYLQEVESALIGPGMRRDTQTRFSPDELSTIKPQELTAQDWEQDTRAIVSTLLRAFPEKQWVIDAGALQILDQAWLPSAAVFTPHAGEFADLLERWSPTLKSQIESAVQELQQAHVPQGSSNPAQVTLLDPQTQPAKLLMQLAADWKNATVVVKGQVDVIFNAEQGVVVTGGNAGLAKGGTGDALAGLIVGFVTRTDPFVSSVVSSTLLKQTAHDLYQTQKEMFSTSDVVEQVPATFAQLTDSHA